MIPRSAAVLTVVVALAGPSCPISIAQEAAPVPLNSPTDLPAYWEALEPAEAGGEARPVGFRDLWDHPDEYRNRRVRVEGKVERRFRQDPAGDLPALAESWVIAPSKDPFCLVYPEPEGGSVAPGDSVRFEGTFLGHVRYAGEDVPRLAPLIVGPAPRCRHPRPKPAASSESPPTRSRRWAGWSAAWPPGWSC